MQKLVVTYLLLLLGHPAQHGGQEVGEEIASWLTHTDSPLTRKAAFSLLC
jgi:hypothetical protein